MTIKTKLLLSIIVTGVLVCIAAFVVYQVSQQIERDINKSGVTQEIVQVTSSRQRLVFDYIRFREERPKTQWLFQEGKLLTLTRSASFNAPADQDALRQIIATGGLVDSTFTKLVSNYERPKTSASEYALSDAVEQTLVSELLANMQENIDSAQRLSDDSIQNIKTGQVVLVIVTGSSAAILLFFLCILFFLFKWYVLGPLRALSEGSVIVGRGDLDHRINIVSTDEIGQVSKAFNEMALKLSVSHNSLEKQVRERTSELQKFRLAVDKAHDHIVITDNNGIIRYANEAVEKITGFTREDVIGKKAGSLELWGGRMDAQFYEKLWRTIKHDKKPFVGEVINKKKTGETYYATLSISPLRGEDGVEYFVELQHDTTREKLTDKAKSEFVSIASHQLRSPATSIRWFAEMLIGGHAGKLKAKQAEYLNEIYLNDRRMIDLINALLSVSRIELGTFAHESVEVNLSSAVLETLDGLSVLMNKRKVTVDFQSVDIVIQSDPQLVRIILQNLISNAVEYTSAGHSISVVLIDGDTSVHISVKDTGLGIPIEAQPRIFHKFFRADNAQLLKPGGNGLGLYITKSIVDALHGSISFTSSESSGTVFDVTLPKCTPARKGTTKLI